MTSYDDQQTFMLISAATLYVPGLVSCVTMPFPIAVCILISASFSILYHNSTEHNFGISDMIFAHIVLFIAIILFVILSMKLGMFHWKIILTALISAAGLAMYLISDKSGEDGTRGDDYWWRHGLWHLFGSLSLLILVAQPADWSLLTCTYKQTLVKAYKTRPITEIEKNGAELVQLIKNEEEVVYTTK